MKIMLFKKIMHFVLNVLKAIVVIFLCILTGDIISLVWNGGHTYEVYKSRFPINDLHDDGFYAFIVVIIIPTIIVYCIEWYIVHKKKNSEE